LLLWFRWSGIAPSRSGNARSVSVTALDTVAIATEPCRVRFPLLDPLHEVASPLHLVRVLSQPRLALVLLPAEHRHLACRGLRIHEAMAGHFVSAKRLLLGSSSGEESALSHSPLVVRAIPGAFAEPAGKVRPDRLVLGLVEPRLGFAPLFLGATYRVPRGAEVLGGVHDVPSWLQRRDRLASVRTS
jgi:hypothetical protein